jgi:glycosyl transferase family 25
MFLVTAYYPIQRSKHSLDLYNLWISIFFECVTCPVIFFCSSKTYIEIHSHAKSNIKFIQREFDSFDMMKEPQMNKWMEWWNIDPEKEIHSPELYAIWACKQEFIREAIKLVDSDVYIWCDAGCFRTKRNGSFEKTLNFIRPGKITCLDVSSLLICEKLIGGGVLAGDKNAWLNFSKNYLDELDKDINGKDQVIYQRILNNSNAIIINPSRKYGDPWFYLTSLFSEESIFKFEYLSKSCELHTADYTNLIDQIVYINLDHRKDRKEQIEKQLSIFSFNKIHRFNAILDKRVDGHVGCGLSHIAILEVAIKKNWKNVLIVEDDMIWNDLSQFNLLDTLIKNSYDVIMFGGTFPNYYINTYKLNECQTTTSYLVNNHYFKKLLDCFKLGTNKLIETQNPPTYAIDQVWKPLQKNDNWYLIYPPLCIQSSGFSDICNTYINYENFYNVKLLTIDLNGGLGNQLFQLAFLLYAAKITNNLYFLDTLNSPPTKHSSEQYFETLLNKWTPYFCKKSVNNKLIENSKMISEDWYKKINSISGDIKLSGYFQRVEYINLIKDEFISKLTFNKSILEKYPDIKNTFFIHIRGGDYIQNSFHFIDLKSYYIECMKKHEDEKFIIFTNDIPYANSLLPNIPIIEESEVNTLYLMSESKGCICSNSTFSWWGAYLNENRPIYFPDKWFNDSSMDTSGLYFIKKQNIKENIINGLNMNLLKLSREKLRYKR